MSFFLPILQNIISFAIFAGLVFSITVIVCMLKDKKEKVQAHKKIDLDYEELLVKLEKFPCGNCKHRKDDNLTYNNICRRILLARIEENFALSDEEYEDICKQIYIPLCDHVQNDVTMATVFALREQGYKVSIFKPGDKFYKFNPTTGETTET